MENLGFSILCFVICYVVVTLVGITHTVFNIRVLKMSAMDENSMGEGYEKTKPWHPLYNIILFPLFGWLYLNNLSNPSFYEALITGAIWLGITIVIDLFGWVIMKHPWSLTFNEFYIKYQPWITLIYISILIGPVIGYFFVI